MNNFNVIENDEDGKLTVTGYVNETGKQSHLLGSKKKFKETIQKGAFTRALKKGNDIHFLAEHDENKILASTRNGSLTLKEDKKGLGEKKNENEDKKQKEIIKKRERKREGKGK